MDNSHDEVGKKSRLINKNFNLQKDQGDQEGREDLENHQHPYNRQQMISQNAFKMFDGCICPKCLAVRAGT